MIAIAENILMLSMMSPMILMGTIGFEHSDRFIPLVFIFRNTSVRVTIEFCKYSPNSRVNAPIITHLNIFFEVFLVLICLESKCGLFPLMLKSIIVQLITIQSFLYSFIAMIIANVNNTVFNHFANIARKQNIAISRSVM